MDAYALLFKNESGDDAQVIGIFDHRPSDEFCDGLVKRSAGDDWQPKEENYDGTLGVLCGHWWLESALFYTQV